MLEDEGEDHVDWDKFSASDSDFGGAVFSTSSRSSGLPSRMVLTQQQQQQTPKKQTEYYTSTQSQSTTRITTVKQAGTPQQVSEEFGTAREVSPMRTETLHPISVTTVPTPTHTAQMARRQVPNITSISVMSHESPVSYIPETLGTLPRGTQNVQSVITVQSERIVPPGQVLHVTAVINPATGRKLSLEQAIKSGLLDIRSGKFVHPQRGSRMSLTEAADEGWIEPGLVKQLQQKCDIRDPSTGRELSILDAMKKGLFDPMTGEITDLRTGRKLTLKEAVDQRLLSRDAATTLSYLSITTSSKSRTHGFYEVGSMKDTGVTLTLADALEKGLYNPRTGKFVDPVSKEEITIQDAMRRGLLDPYAKDIVHPVTGEKLSLEDAISQGVVDPKSGQYVDPRSGRRVTLDEATSRSLLLKPISLHSALTEGLVDDRGLIKDIRTGRKLTLTEAIEKGILDTDIKCILDPRTNELLSLEEAMERGLINPRGEYVDPHTGRRMSIQVHDVFVWY